MKVFESWSRKNVSKYILEFNWEIFIFGKKLIYNMNNYVEAW